MQSEMARLLQLTELRVEIYKPRPVAATPTTVGQKRPRLEDMIPPSERPQEWSPERLPLPPPSNRSGTSRGGDELPWEFVGAGTKEWNAGWAACERMRDLEDEVRSLRRELSTAKSEVEMLRPLEVENSRMWKAVRGMKSCLSDAIGGWGDMWECAQEHGWNSELKFEDRDRNACVWSLHDETEFAKPIRLVTRQ